MGGCCEQQKEDIHLEQNFTHEKPSHHQTT